MGAVHAYALDAEQESLRARARTLGAGPLAAVARHGPEGRVNRPLIRQLAETGLLARLFPSDAVTGSARVSAMDLCLMREGLASTCTEAELALALQGLGGYPILLSGSATAVKHWMPRVASGEAVAAFALSEPDSGSDPASLECRAERVGDGWVLTGTKTWISNAPEADVYTLFARTTPGAGARGVTAFCVAGDAPGLSGEPLRLMAPHPIGTLHLDGVRVGADDLLGEVDGGFQVAMRTLDLFRPSVGAAAVGMAQAALDLAVQHARDRRQGGKPLAEHQAIAHSLADMAVRVEASRLLVHAAASAHDAGVLRNTRAAAMAKLHATEAAQAVIDAAIQVLGARGLVDTHPLSHLYREVRAMRIYEGTSEIQRTIIARELIRNA